MILAFLAMILICFLMSVLFSFIPAGIIWAVWNFVVLAIWPTLPIIGFWQMYLILLAISFIASLFRSKVTINE